ncbi:MAG: hypothetical protein QM640_05060 [Niabella sp.]
MGPPKPHARERVYYEPGIPKPKRMPDPKYRNTWTQQVSAAYRILAPLSTASGNDHLTISPLSGIVISYEKDFFNNWLGIGISPFVALNRKALGGVVDIKTNLKRSGKVRIGIGGQYMFSNEDVVTNYNIGESDFVARRYNSNVSRLLFTGAFDFHFTPKIFLKTDIGLGGVVSNSHKSSNVPSGWSAGNYNGRGVAAYAGIGNWLRLQILIIFPYLCGHFS